MIIATGGMERSGSNYTNYVMFLHPDLRVVNYPTPAEVLPGMGYQDIAKFHKMPLVVPGFIKKDPVLYEWHKRQEEKKEFKGVCFKYDRGETWYKNVAHELSSRVLFIYCVRDLAKVVTSWKRRVGAVYTDKAFVECFKGSVEGALAMQKTMNVTYGCMNVAEPMDKIRERFRDIHEKAGLEMGEMQELFLQDRRIVGGRVFERTESDEETLAGLFRVDPGIQHWIDGYNSLLL
jgi:hypothetical protein